LETPANLHLGWLCTLFLSGLAWLWIAGEIWWGRRQPSRALPWTGLPAYGVARASLAWLLMLLPAFDAPLGIARLTLIVPGGALAWVAWKKMGAVSERSQRNWLRLASGLMALDACLGTLTLPPILGLPKLLIGALPAVKVLEAALVLGILAAIVGHRRAQRTPAPSQSLLRRWSHAGLFVLVAVVGCALVGAGRSWVVERSRAATSVAGDAQAPALLVAAESDSWSQMTSERLRTGLPVLGVFILLVLGLWAAYVFQNRPVRRSLSSRRPTR
jgi:hypothetical protein